MPLHPFLIHFPIAAWVLGTGVLIAGFIARRGKAWHGCAWFLLISGAVLAIPAALAGQQDYATLAHLDIPALHRHRNLGNLLPWLMGAVVLLKTHVTFAKRAPAISDVVWVLLATAICALLLYTGWLGGTVVYRYDIPAHLR